MPTVVSAELAAICILHDYLMNCLIETRPAGLCPGMGQLHMLNSYSNYERGH